MQRPFKIVCRGSRLSRAQADIFIRKLVQSDPTASAEIIIKDTKGDANQDLPLEEMEGKDFFTKDIHDFLVDGHADFAVHSLKDVSGDNFFEGNHYALIERDDPRDVAIFGEDISKQPPSVAPLRIGTSSPRRAEMATGFLRRALPSANGAPTNVEAVPIRGNVDTRLQKLAAKEFDGIILACAGLNRLLRYDDGTVAGLLKGKRIMLLPLLVCPPAPGQGAIVAETMPGNALAVSALRTINDVGLSRSVDVERKIAHRYGSGCHQKFGVVYVPNEKDSFVFASGKDRSDKEFALYFSSDGSAGRPPQKTKALTGNDLRVPDTNIVWIAPGKAATLSRDSRHSQIWVSETETWYELAARGFWVEGSAEGMGADFIDQSLQSPLVGLSRKLNNEMN